MVKIRNTNGVTATVGDSSSPVVTSVVKGQPTLDDVQGFSVDFNAVANGQILTYQASSNTFVPLTLDTGNTDYGVFNDGDF
jgi:hypothetical protein